MVIHSILNFSVKKIYCVNFKDDDIEKSIELSNTDNVEVNKVKLIINHLKLLKIEYLFKEKNI